MKVVLKDKAGNAKHQIQDSDYIRWEEVMWAQVIKVQ